MNNFKRYVSFIFLIIFLYAFYSYIQQNIEILNQISSIQTIYIWVIFLFSVMNYIIKARLNIDIYSFTKIQLSVLESLRIVIRSTALNLSGPVNIGAGYKLHYLKKKYGLNIIENFSINTAYAFYLNYFYIIIIFFITLGTNLSGSENSVYLNLFLLVTIIALFIFFKIITSKKLEIIKVKFLKDNIEKLLIGFQYFKEQKECAKKLFVASNIYILISIIYFQTIMISVGFNITLHSLLVLHCISSIVNLIKLTPGNIGFLEISLIFFQGLHGITTNQIIIFSVISRIISFVTLLLLLIFDSLISKN